MGNYDLGQEKPEGIKCTLYELEMEIVNEHPDIESYTYDNVKGKFRNSERCGIIDHLEDDLDFRISEYDDDYKKLQLLKLLFRYEKDEAGAKIPITELFNKPRLENIKSEYLSDSLYGKAMEALKVEIAEEIGVEKANTRIIQLYQMNQRWNNFLGRMIMHAYDEKAVSKEMRDMTYFDLKNYQRFLNDKMCSKLGESKHFKPNEDVFMAFFTLLIMHGMVCEEEDRVESYSCAEIYPSKNEEYVDRFVKAEKQVLSVQEQNRIIENLINNPKSEKFYYNLIFGKGYKCDSEDISGLRLVQKYLSVIRKWLEKHKELDEKNETMYGAWLVAIIQEVIYCKKNKIAVKNDAYGVTEKRRTLTAILKNPDSAQAKQIQMWMIRIENRYASDIGTSELLEIARDIEKKHTELRRWMLKFHNWSDLDFVDNSLVHFMERMTLPRWVTKISLDRFVESLRSKNPSYQVDLTNFPQIYDFGRELYLNESVMNTVVCNITNKIKLFEKQGFILTNEKEEKEYIDIEYKNDGIRRFVLDYWIIRGNSIQLRVFFELVSDDIASRYSDYGLSEFMKLEV